MFKLFYKKNGGGYIIEKIECDIRSDNLALQFDEPMKGIVRIGADVKELSGSRVIFDTDGWQNGIFTPILYLASRAEVLEAFEMRGGAPAELPYGKEFLKELAMRLEKTERRLAELSEELAGLEGEVKGKPIF